EDIEWPAIEPEPPTGDPAADFHFEAADALIDAIAEAGLEPQVRLMSCATTAGGDPFWGTQLVPFGIDPSMDEKGPCTTMPPMIDAQYDDFVFNVVKHYAEYKHPVRFFSINNEINAVGQWPGSAGRRSCTMGSCPVLDDYIHTLEVAYRAAHRANPGVVIL